MKNVFIVGIALVIALVIFAGCASQPVSVPSSSESSMSSEATFDYQLETWKVVENEVGSPTPTRVLGKERNWELGSLIYVEGSFKWQGVEVTYKARWADEDLTYLLIADEQVFYDEDREIEKMDEQ